MNAILQQPAAEYYADTTRLSHSMLEVFRESPELFYGRFISEEFPGDEPTDAMKLGTVIHDAVLCGGAEVLCREIPNEVLDARGARRGKAWCLFASEHAGFALLRRREMEVVRRVTAACQSHPMARKLLDFDGGGASEQVLRWKHEATGTLCRGRCDRITGAFVADLKTTSETDLSRLADRFCRYGYHRQAAFYLDGMRANGSIGIGFAFIVAQTVPPYSVVTAVLDSDFIGLGFAENDALLERFAECKRIGRWQTEEYGRLLTLPRPRWAGCN